MTLLRLLDVAVISATTAAFAVHLPGEIRLLIGFLAAVYAIVRIAAEVVRRGQAIVMGDER